MAFANTAYNAWQAHHLASGEYTISWEELAIDLPGTVGTQYVTGDKITNGKYTCILFNGKYGTSTSITCQYRDALKYLEYRLFPNDTRYCIVPGSWALANTVCTSLGGNFDFASGTDNFYKLP